MEPCHLRRLLPAPGDPSTDGGDSGEQSAAADRRSRPTRVACNACRQKKSACDSKRPQCTPCRRKGTECVYISKDTTETPGMALKREVETLRGRTRDLEELISHLSHMQDNARRQILLLLRTAADPVSLLPLVRGNIVQTQLSVHGTEQSFTPDFQAQSPLGTMIQHSQTNPPPSQYSDASSDRTIQSIAGTELSSFVPSVLAQHGPDLRGRFADLRLENLDISFWSTVPVTNLYAASAISMHLETGHQFLGMFHAELFIGDLVKHRLRFCSSFLVTALLAFASQKYSSLDPDAFVRSYEFEAEALRLWEVEHSQDSINNLAGLFYLYNSMRMHGNISTGAEYLVAARAMASNLKLSGVKERLDTESTLPLTDEEQHAITCAAWGTLNALI
ncbi:hypothetical protein Micbo1qcDRAFT_202772 [Microdochium bolleyi]|uniref:Zn(2)-C6 fungal-type domain-containing protein n=1 Tax=Microdochium bolleyi TaxID=196109 RepID=A0A136J600_9PEZI|nr:hypothetical protein Micbo1qcDRAFT_202772 [Microdochium bolleyi]